VSSIFSCLTLSCDSKTGPRGATPWTGCRRTSWVSDVESFCPMLPVWFITLPKRLLVFKPAAKSVLFWDNGSSILVLGYGNGFGCDVVGSVVPG